MLTVEGLRSRYGRIEVLHGIDLHVGSGEIVTVVGANGAGKTTLLRCLSGIQPVSSGRDRASWRAPEHGSGLPPPGARSIAVAGRPPDLHEPLGRGEPAPWGIPLLR